MVLCALEGYDDDELYNNIGLHIHIDIVQLRAYVYKGAEVKVTF